MSGINEEEVKIRERLTSLETKITFIQELLREIRDELKDNPSKEDYDYLAGQISGVKKDLAEVKKTQDNQMIRLGIVSGILGVVGGLLIKFLMG